MEIILKISKLRSLKNGVEELKVKIYNNLKRGKIMQEQVSAIIRIVPFIFITALFYIFVIIPEKKRKKQYDAMLERLRINDEIITKGGIIGKVIKNQKDFVIVESGPDKVKFKLKKNGIASITSVVEAEK